MKYSSVILFLIFIMPVSAKAQVKISEIAWMGTTESQFSEWIELYNPTDTSIDLSGWKLYEAGGGTLVFSFTKTIEANGYLLLERTTSSAPDAVPGVNDESGSFGGAGLANTGEYLVLKDNTGQVVDDLDFQSGWPAGDSTTKETMQLVDNDWVTASPSPKEDNSDIENIEVESEETEEIEEDIIPKVSPNKPYVEFVTPNIIFPGVSYPYSISPVLEYNYRINKGNFYFNMGDGTVYRQNDLATINHIYQYDGDYTISFLYTDPKNHNPSLKGTKKVKVIKPVFSLAIVDDKGLEIKNTSSSEIDLSGWVVVTDTKQISIPDMTIISPKSKVVIPFSILSLEKTKNIVVLDPSRNKVAETMPAKNNGQTLGVYQDSASEIYEGIDSQNELFTDDFIVEASEKENKEIQNRIKTYIFGAVSLFVIVLSILLERFMARQEY